MAAEIRLSKRLSAGNRQPATGNPRRGFTLIELMVVILIIGILIGLLMAGIHAAKIAAYRNEAKLAVNQMTVGIVSMKRNYSFETVIGAYTSGRTVKGETKFQDFRRDLAADGLAAGDKLYILSGKDAGPRNIVTVAQHELVVDGDSFSASEIDLDFYAVKDDGSFYPEINIGRELDPTNREWSKPGTAGQTVKDGYVFSDADGRDFAAEGVVAGDILDITSGDCAGVRRITAVSGNELTVDGNKFRATESSLGYLVARVHLNSRLKEYYPCKAKRIQTVDGVKRLVDPWLKPYVYRLRWVDLDKNGTDDTLVEELVCSGLDQTLDTRDDCSNEISRLRVGE